MILLLRNVDALSFGGGCNPRIDHDLGNRIPILSNNELQVQVRQALDDNSLGSGAVRLHGICTGAGTPARREEAICRHRVDLGLSKQWEQDSKSFRGASRARTDDLLVANEDVPRFSPRVLNRLTGHFVPLLSQ